MKQYLVSKSEARLSMDQSDLEAKEGLLQAFSSSTPRPVNRRISCGLFSVIISSNIMVLSLLPFVTFKFNGARCVGSHSDSESEP